MIAILDDVAQAERDEGLLFVVLELLNGRLDDEASEGVGPVEPEGRAGARSLLHLGREGASGAAELARHRGPVPRRLGGVLLRGALHVGLAYDDRRAATPAFDERV